MSAPRPEIVLRPVTAPYVEVIDDLRTAYDSGVERRDRTEKQPWKLAERDAFRGRVAAAGGRRLLEVGAGTGQDAEGIADEDWHHPPRFFSWRTDEQLRAFARESFDTLDFHVVGRGSQRFQSLTLLRPEHAERLGEPALG